MSPTFKDRVARKLQDIADRAGWPAGHSLVGGVLNGIPPDENSFESGLIPILALAVDRATSDKPMIPETAGRLIAQEHLRLTPEVVRKISSDLNRPSVNPDSDGAWILALLSLAAEQDQVNAPMFEAQMAEFRRFAQDPILRLRRVLGERQRLARSYGCGPYGMAMGVHPDSLLGAYIDGHKFAGFALPLQRGFVMGTYYPSLGLEEAGFQWTGELDDIGGRMSIQVQEDRGYARLANVEQLMKAAEIAKRHLAAESI